MEPVHWAARHRAFSERPPPRRLSSTIRSAIAKELLTIVVNMSRLILTGSGRAMTISVNPKQDAYHHAVYFATSSSCVKHKQPASSHGYLTAAQTLVIMATGRA